MAARNLPSAPRGSPRILPRGNQSFPKSVRILRSKDFRKVYDTGTRHSCRLFTAFCVFQPAQSGEVERKADNGPHIGFTTPRALGNAVVRNRIRRRVREVVRANLAELNPKWSIVINPRRKALDCPFQEIEHEVRKLFLRCSAS